MRWLLYIFLLCAFGLFAATPRVPVSGWVSTNGWDVWLVVTNMTTNGSYTMGLGTNNTLTGTQKCSVAWTEMGYNAATPTTYTRHGALVLPVQEPFAGPTYNDEFLNGDGNAVLRLALSDWMTSQASNIVVTILPEFYTEGGASNEAAVITLTNLSVQVFQLPDSNWSWPGANWETNTTMVLRAVAFANDPADRKPVEAMQFIVTFPNGASITNTETEMVIDSSMTNDLFRTGEFVSVFNMATLTNLAATNLFRARCDFHAISKYGDTNANFDTRRNTYVWPTAMPTSITNLCDPLRVYTDLIVRVGLDGSDANGQPTNCAPADVAAGHKFFSIKGALSKAAATNNIRFGHNDVGGVICYVDSGVTNWSGSTAGVGGVPDAYCWIMPTPGHSVTLTNDTGNDDISDRIRITGITLGFQVGTPTPFSGIELLWLDRCTINSTLTAVFQTTVALWITHSAITNLGQGLKPFGNQNTSFLLRGCDLDGFNATIVLRFFMGNRHTQLASGFKLMSDFTGLTAVTPEHAICYNSYFGGLTISGAAAVDIGLNTAITKGLTIANCTFENSTNDGTSVFNLCSLNTINFTNVKVFNCDWVGKRVAGVFYNDSGTAPAWRIQCIIRNSIFDNTGFKGWNFPTTNVARIGNMSVMYNVGWSGNLYIECNTTGIDAPGSFNPDFVGLNSYHPVGSGTNLVSFPAFTDRRSTGSVYGDPAPGNGNYRLLSYSPAFRVPALPVLAFDLYGRYRGGIDPPGPHVDGNVKKGAFF